MCRELFCCHHHHHHVIVVLVGLWLSGRSMQNSLDFLCHRRQRKLKLLLSQHDNYMNIQTCHNTLSAPLSLHSLLNYHTPTRGLRCANTNLLSAPRVRTTFASRGFSVAAPAVWNSLPSGIHDASSTHTFRRLLKTHCFQQAFGSP